MESIMAFNMIPNLSVARGLLYRRGRIIVVNVMYSAWQYLAGTISAVLVTQTRILSSVDPFLGFGVLWIGALGGFRIFSFFPFFSVSGPVLSCPCIFYFVL